MPSEATVAKIQTCVLATFSLPNAITAVHFDKSGTRILMTSYDDRIRGKLKIIFVFLSYLLLIVFIPLSLVFIVDPLDIKSINDESFVPATIVKVGPSSIRFQSFFTNHFFLLIHSTIIKQELTLVYSKLYSLIHLLRHLLSLLEP